MPNYVTNRMVITGKQTHELVEAITRIDKKEGRRVVDFQLIAPQPLAIRLHPGYVEGQQNIFDAVQRGLNAEGLELQKHVIKGCETWRPVQQEESLDQITTASDADRKLASEYLRSVEQVTADRCSTWYDWNCRYWGTKWNALHCKVPIIDATSPDPVILYFDTAWSMPVPLFDILAEKYPETEGWTYAFDEGHCFYAYGYWAEEYYYHSVVSNVDLSNPKGGAARVYALCYGEPYRPYEEE